ncbi:MAG TPA: dimethylargininase [Acidimicrobiia bacterium]|nr:dimethylargininase [Acidimicrobiia bacterium]
MPTAWIREVPDSFVSAIVPEGGRAPDVPMARRQHETYRRHLERAGHEVITLPADEGYPDCVFIEDAAVLLGSLAVAARPGAEPRRGEVEPVVAALGGRFELVRVEAPGTLDGGDVMALGDMVYVGRSKRTNDEGIAQMRKFAAGVGMTVQAVPVSGVLHLKSAVLPVTEDTVVVTPGTVDESLLAGLRIIAEAETERHRFSALPLGNGEVLVTADAAETASRLDDLGIALTPIDASEIQAADGGLTCMSILARD